MDGSAPSHGPWALIRLAVRSPEKAADLAAKGVQVAAADYDDAQSLVDAFTGADKVLLISSSAVGQRARQHQNAIDAAVKAGVGFVAYTSILKADSSRSVLADEHRATEAALAASGLPHAVLRNGWYTENYTENLAAPQQMGTFLGSAGEGKVSAATRADYAAAAVAVLTSEDQAGKVYELGGDEAFTMAELAAEVSRQTGTQLPYTDLPEAEYQAGLEAAGVPGPFAHVLANADTALSLGDLYDDSHTLSALIGRPTTPLADAVAAAV